MLQTISIIISGKVQGVYFRQSTLEKANELNVTGTVKNLADGRVQIVATGTPDALQRLVEWCWVGPRRAKVTDVKQEICVSQNFSSFQIER